MTGSTHQKHNGIAVINLSGELNVASLSAFREEVADQLLKGAKKIIVDCRELGFITSSGLAALLWARSRASGQGNKIYFTHVSAMVTEVLEMTKLSGLLRIAPTTRGLLRKFGMIRKPTGNKASLASRVVRK